MTHTIIYPDYLDAVKYAIDTHNSVLIGKGKISGKKFASLIRERFNQSNPINRNAAELAELFIANIELTDGNSIRWQFK